MKNKVVVSVILVMVLFVGCGSSAKKALEEQKKQEEAEKMGVINGGVVGQCIADNNVAGKEFKYDLPSSVHSFRLKFDKNTNSCIFKLNTGYVIKQLECTSAEYEVIGNKIVFDFKKHNTAMSKITKENIYEMYKNAFFEELKKQGIDESEFISKWEEHCVWYKKNSSITIEEMSEKTSTNLQKNYKMFLENEQKQEATFLTNKIHFDSFMYVNIDDVKTVNNLVFTKITE